MKIARIGLLILDTVLLFFGAICLVIYVVSTRATAQLAPLSQNTLQIYFDMIHDFERCLLICAVLMLAAGIFHILLGGKLAAKQGAGANSPRELR